MADIFVSPTGSGDKSGSSPANALPVTSIDKAIQLAGPGGSVLMLADQGSYNLTTSVNISHGGTAEAPITVKGVDSFGNEMNVQINGTRMPDYVVGGAAGNEVFKLLAGASNLVFENMNFANVGTAFRAGADISNIVIQDIYADNVRRFFEDYASGTNTSATVSGLTIRNVEVHGFSKGVVRLQYDSHDILIENVYGDSERQDGDGIAIGVHLEGTVHAVIIRGVTMENAQSSTTDYWNGDGFATERGVYNVLLEDTVARGNADGGYDLKSNDTTLIRAIAEDNGRNFRLWGEATLIDPVGIDPHKWGGSIGGQIQIQVMNGANVTVIGGSFSDSGSSTVVAVNDGGGILTFNGTKIIHADGGRLTLGTDIFGIDPALVTQVQPTGSYSVTEPVQAPTAPEVDSAPTDLQFQQSNLPENAASGTSVGFLTPVDATANDSFTYAFVDNAGGRFALNSLTGEVTVLNGSLLDYESAASHTILVRVTDSSGLSLEKQLVIEVTNVSEPKVLNGTSYADTLSVATNDDWTISGLAGNDVIQTRGGSDTLRGGAGNDRIESGGGNDVILFNGKSEGFDAINAGEGQDTILALSSGTVIGVSSLVGVEVISANGYANVEIIGSAANDVIDLSSIVLQGIQKVSGGTGNDRIVGSAQADVIAGNAGADQLSGGDGADIFKFGWIGDSRSGSGIDVIQDFQVGTDRIDLTGIDASTKLSGNQAFSFIGSAGFTKVAGQVRVDTSDQSRTMILGDVNGDGVADFRIDLAGFHQMAASDFLL